MLVSGVLCDYIVCLHGKKINKKNCSQYNKIQTIFGSNWYLGWKFSRKTQTLCSGCCLSIWHLWAHGFLISKKEQETVCHFNYFFFFPPCFMDARLSKDKLSKRSRSHPTSSKGSHGNHPRWRSEKLYFSWLKKEFNCSALSHSGAPLVGRACPTALWISPSNLLFCSEK